MVKITFPDGSVRSYEQGVTGFQIAESISPALARSVVSCGVNGETVELNRPINEDATIELYKFDDEQGKHTFWHTSAHLLAEALQELYPGIQFGFGGGGLCELVRKGRRRVYGRCIASQAAFETAG